MTGYFWITLADRFGDNRAAEAGPFADLDEAMRRGRKLAREVGQMTYTMAEFDAVGNQLSEAAAWLAMGCDLLAAADDARTISHNDAPEPAPGLPVGGPPVADGLAEVYGQNASESDMAPIRSVPSRWALKRRREAARNARRPRR